MFRTLTLGGSPQLVRRQSHSPRSPAGTLMLAENHGGKAPTRWEIAGRSATEARPNRQGGGIRWLEVSSAICARFTRERFCGCRTLPTISENLLPNISVSMSAIPHVRKLLRNSSTSSGVHDGRLFVPGSFLSIGLIPPNAMLTVLPKRTVRNCGCFELRMA